MDDTWIQSAQNSKLKLLRGIRAGKERGFALLEGARVLADALHASVKPDWVLYDPRLLDGESVGLSTLRQAQDLEIPCLPCEPKLLAADQDLNSNARIIGCAPRPDLQAKDLFQAAAAASGLVVVSAGIQDPGNAGALIRVAAGLGAFGMIFLQGGVSPWHPRAIRGASGTTFRLPVAEGLRAEELPQLCKEFQIDLWATSSAGKPLQDLKRTGPVALILGVEGAGVPADLLEACQQQVGIPLQRNVESLNVATAAAILVHAFA